MKYKTIQDLIQAEHPIHFRTGKWGCNMIGKEGETLKGLQEFYPHGKFADTITATYWYWLDHDYTNGELCSCGSDCCSCQVCGKRVCGMLAEWKTPVPGKTFNGNVCHGCSPATGERISSVEHARLIETNH